MLEFCVEGSQLLFVEEVIPRVFGKEDSVWNRFKEERRSVMHQINDTGAHVGIPRRSYQHLHGAPLRRKDSTSAGPP